MLTHTCTGRHSSTRLRITFAGGKVLGMTFSPYETVGAVLQAVKGTIDAPESQAVNLAQMSVLTLLVLCAATPLTVPVATSFSQDVLKLDVLLIDAGLVPSGTLRALSGDGHLLTADL